MRISVFHNSGQKSIDTAKQLTVKLQQAGFELDDKTPEVVVTVGGDGTLLSAFHRYANMLEKVRFIGVHTGHLGFYTDWRDFELDPLVAALKKDSGQSVSYPLLDVVATFADQSTSHYWP